MPPISGHACQGFKGLGFLVSGGDLWVRGMSRRRRSQLPDMPVKDQGLGMKCFCCCRSPDPNNPQLSEMGREGGREMD